MHEKILENTISSHKDLFDKTCELLEENKRQATEITVKNNAKNNDNWVEQFQGSIEKLERQQKINEQRVVEIL